MNRLRTKAQFSSYLSIYSLFDLYLDMGMYRFLYDL